MERRTFKRHPIRIEVEARVGGRGSRTFVSDLSITGCTIECSAGFVSPGDEIAIKTKDGMRIAGRMVWVNGRTGGMRFAHTLHPSILAHFGSGGAGQKPDVNLRDQFGRAMGERQTLRRGRLV